MSEIMKLRNFIVDEVKKAMPETSDKDVEKIQNILQKATPDEVYRVANMFSRFDVKTIFEIITENKERERKGA